MDHAQQQAYECKDQYNGAGAMKYAFEPVPVQFGIQPGWEF
jgi:hypothetical protein